MGGGGHCLCNYMYIDSNINFYIKCTLLLKFECFLIYKNYCKCAFALKSSIFLTNAGVLWSRLFDPLLSNGEVMNCMPQYVIGLTASYNTSQGVFNRLNQA